VPLLTRPPFRRVRWSELEKVGQFVGSSILGVIIHDFHYFHVCVVTGAVSGCGTSKGSRFYSRQGASSW
jgi:hypothetical protein